MREADPSSTNVKSPFYRAFFGWTLVGGLLLLVGTPLTLVFLDRLLDPSAPPREDGNTIAQLAISLAIVIAGLACVTWRCRVWVDGITRSVTWSKHVLGLRVSSETWPAADIEAIVVKKAYGLHEERMSYFDIELVGNRGRRPMRLSTGRLVDEMRAWDWAVRLGVPFRDEREAAAIRVPARARNKWWSRARGKPSAAP